MAESHVMIYDHTHRPHRKDFSGKVFINAGSMGKPKDGDERASVTLIEISRQDVRHVFLRVPYDIEKITPAILSNGLPTALADKLGKTS